MPDSKATKTNTKNEYIRIDRANEKIFDLNDSGLVSHQTVAGSRYFFPYPFLDLDFFLLIFIFHFENLSKFIIFSNEDVRRIEPQTNNHKSNY